MSLEKVISSIEFELSQMDKNLNQYENLLRDAAEEKPDLVEMTAIASVLHSFYNGIENMFFSTSFFNINSIIAPFYLL